MTKNMAAFCDSTGRLEQSKYFHKVELGLWKQLFWFMFYYWRQK